LPTAAWAETGWGGACSACRRVVKVGPMHEFIAQNRDELLRLVTRDMKASTPEWNEEELAQGFDVLLDEIVRALRKASGEPSTSPLPQHSEVARSLGSRRQAKGYEIAKIATDIGAISSSLGELARQRGITFPAGQYQVFNQCIDAASASALDEFWNRAREQREHDEATRVGFVIHELRNSVSSARLSFALLRRGELGINSKTGDVLDRSLRRLSTLIDEMLLAVQLQAGRKLDARRLSLAKLIADVMDAAVPERSILLEARVDEGVSVCGDESLLVSAVSNLVQNALKFTHESGRVELRGFLEGSSVVVEVEDECGGLPPGKQDELFAPFVRGTSDRPGIGLGLAITREAVKAHGGEVSVNNLPGKGCVFRVTIPASPP
jgi:signal transduction histidine kinase